MLWRSDGLKLSRSPALLHVNGRGLNGLGLHQHRAADLLHLGLSLVVFSFYSNFLKLKIFTFFYF